MEEQKRPPKIMGGPLIDAIAKAMRMDVHGAQRIIIDIPHNGVVRVYTQFVGDAGLLDIDWARFLKDAEASK